MSATAAHRCVWWGWGGGRLSKVTDFQPISGHVVSSALFYKVLSSLYINDRSHKTISQGPGWSVARSTDCVEQTITFCIIFFTHSLRAQTEMVASCSCIQLFYQEQLKGKYYLGTT